MKTFLDYGRYNDDPAHVGCPRAKSDMTPCSARDGMLAEDNGYCVGCNISVAKLLKELVFEITDPEKIETFVMNYLDKYYPETQLYG